MRVSIRDVAQRAGVSPVTVSNVLRGRAGKAAPETCERVLNAVRELGYAPVPQPTIQSRHVATRVIGLIFDHIAQEDSWGVPTSRGLRDGALEHSYDLMTLLRSKPKWMLDQAELQFLDRRSDGYIFVVPKDRYGVLETLVSHRIPCVACYTADVPDGVATIVLDDANAMKQATDHLISHGHERIALFIHSAERSDFSARMEGYRAAMKKAGLARHVAIVHTDREEDWQAKIIELVEVQGVTGILGVNDDHASEILDLAQGRGWRVPEDLSVIGMDDKPNSAWRGLTTLRFSSEDVGRFAVDAIVGLLNGQSAAWCSRVLPVELVERTSVAAPRHK